MKNRAYDISYFRNFYLRGFILKRRTDNQKTNGVCNKVKSPNYFVLDNKVKEKHVRKRSPHINVQRNGTLASILLHALRDQE